MKLLNVILFNMLLVCNFAFGNSNVVITGTLGMRAIPCFGEVCPCVDVVNVTNDTASFVLVKDGQYILDFSELGKEYYWQSIASFLGNISKKQEYSGQDFYELDITAVLKEVSSDNFTVNCVEGASIEDQSTSPVITIENDSVIIQHTKFEQCCAKFELKVSEVVKDTLYVTFTDTTIAGEACKCMCNFDVRISAIKTELQTLKVYYNGVVYDLNTSDIKQINNQYIQILPNPTEGIIEIRGVENYDNMNYEVYNSVGQMTQSGKLKQMIDLSSRKGIYILTIMQNQKIITQEKIIVK